MNTILKKEFLYSTLKKIWIVLAILIILGAIFSSVFRSLTPWAKQYKTEVERQLSRMLAQPVRIKTMETGWYWFQPVIKLKQVDIEEASKTNIHLDKLYIGVNILQSIWHWKIQPSMLYVEKAHLILREKAGKWQLDGISSDFLLKNEKNPDTVQALSIWLAKQDSLILRQISLDVYFSDGRLLPVRGLEVSIFNSGSYYRVKGSARLKQVKTSLFNFTGELQYNPSKLEQINGKLYFSAKNIAPAQWPPLMPQLSKHLEGGEGDLELWMDLKNGAISFLQAQFKFSQLVLHLTNTGTQLIQYLEANLVWKPDDKGWQFQADKIHLRADGVNWPENKISIAFDKEQNSYRLYVQSLILESLLSLKVDWPDSIKKIQKLNLHGLLSNSQFLIKDNQAFYILSRFDHFGGTNEDSRIRVDNLAGVLNWQAQEGRLELDSEHSILAIKGLPAQQIRLLNGSLEWKQLNNGLRLSIDRFVLSQTDLTVSAEGVLDEVSKQSIGRIQMDADFSANNIQQWLHFIPSQYLKPNLNYWLKNDLKRIAKASGKIHINGMAKDFPFDNNTGEFSILAHLNGGELFINPNWQLITDIEAYLRANNRDLDIDVVNADFQGVPAKQINLRIENIGKDQEKLLIHGLIQGLAENIQQFVMASPLQNTLWALKSMTIKHLISLDLRLEIPLYQSSPVLAQGDIEFKNNSILFDNPIGELTLEDLSGPLHFDANGITESSLQANALGYPFTINIQSKASPEPNTSIQIHGESSIESLEHRFNLPLFSVLKGRFSLESELKLPKDPLHHPSLSVKSDLEGLAIHLPSPLGKNYDTKIPLEVNLDFEQGIRVRAKYNDHLSGDIFLKKGQKNYRIASGEIRLGSTQAVDQKLPGLAIVGSLDDFDLPAWSKVFTGFSSEKSKFKLSHFLRQIRVSLGKLTFLNQSYDNMSIKAKILPDKSWSFNINQKNIAGDLQYQPDNNFLSGYVNFLHLEPFETSRLSSKIHPKQIPNLNLRIDNLSFGAKKIGNMTLKSQSTGEQWLIQYCRIESPFYQLDISGDWIQKDKTNKTNMDLNLQIQNLAKSLEHWNIVPAVDASRGEMEFRGHWNDSLLNFSLASLNGEMNLKLKNGVITNLSPETESKIGLGKLLSILSLQTIPRRLQLDFSDLSQKGFSFDIFQGHFTVEKGIMKTYDSYLDGPVASATMKGILDLVKRVYDLDLKITPHITASLPVVATIAGGPIAGVAMWMANKMIINQGMQKISGYSYKISGPWSQPVVQQLKIIRGP